MLYWFTQRLNQEEQWAECQLWRTYFVFQKYMVIFLSISKFFGCVPTNQYEMLLDENSKNC